VVVLCLAALPAEAGRGNATGQGQSWTGVISDSMCKLHHESGAEGQETTEPDCTRDCVKGGSRYVLVAGETVYAIANQDQKQLAEHAGVRVLVRGTLRGDVLEVTSIEKAR
jgi:hypothetical protein